MDISVFLRLSSPHIIIYFPHLTAIVQEWLKEQFLDLLIGVGLRGTQGQSDKIDLELVVPFELIVVKGFVLAEVQKPIYCLPDSAVCLAADLARMRVYSEVDLVIFLGG